MAEPAKKAATQSAGIPDRALDVDRFVSLMIRRRRTMLGLTQQQMAELIGVTYQQAQKYETGISRISAGRLYQIARVLGVEISHFFEDVEPGSSATRNQELMSQQRMLLELARNFAAIEDPSRQKELCALARTYAEHGGSIGGDTDGADTLHIRAPLKFVAKLMGAWAIDEEGTASLLGFDEGRDVGNLLSGSRRLDTRDCKDRVRHLMRIREALHSLFQDLDTERKWLHEPRPELQAQSPLALLLEGSMENLLTVSQFVQWMVGR